jgi:uncharacterized coiled-coil protein SlyX
MTDLAKIMRRLADEIEKEEKGEQTAAAAAATEERIAQLEAQLAKADPTVAELREAMDEVTDEEWELVKEHRAGKKKAAPIVEEEPEPVKAMRPGRKKGKAYQFTVDDEGRVQKTDIAHIYSGDDEPDEVELPGDEVAA